MAKHTKKRERHLTCRVCGGAFITGSSIKHHCSIECRIKEAEKNISDGGCWEWVGSINPATGYGQMSAWEGDKRILYTAHRVSFRAFVGDIPNGMSVLHKCDNRKCFNPDHLFVGTQSDNMVDMIQKNRRTSYTKPAVSWHKLQPEKVRRGSRHPMAKLSEEQVVAIRASNEPLASIALKYGMSYGNIRAIRNGEIWTHLDSAGNAFR